MTIPQVPVSKPRFQRIFDSTKLAVFLGLKDVLLCKYQMTLGQRQQKEPKRRFQRIFDSTKLAVFLGLKDVPLCKYQMTLGQRQQKEPLNFCKSHKKGPL
jgi:hypothetical protein